MTVVVEGDTLGACWLDISRRILDDGVDGTYDGLPMRELALVTLVVERPDPEDEAIAELGDPEWSAWMKANSPSPARSRSWAAPRAAQPRSTS